jgi:hypothetical protein
VTHVTWRHQRRQPTAKHTPARSVIKTLQNGEDPQPG